MALDLGKTLDDFKEWAGQGELGGGAAPCVGLLLSQEREQKLSQRTQGFC